MPTNLGKKGWNGSQLLKATETMTESVALVSFSKTPNRTMHGNKDGDVLNLLQNTETLTESTASHWNSIGIFSQDSIRCSSVKKSNVYCWDKMRHQRISQEESHLCQCSMTFPVDQKTTKKNAWQLPGQWSFIGPGSEKKWYCISEDSPQGVWDNICWKDVGGIRRKRMSNFPRYEPIVQMSTQKQRTWKTVDTPRSRFGYDWDFFFA